MLLAATDPTGDRTAAETIARGVEAAVEALIASGAISAPRFTPSEHFAFRFAARRDRAQT